MRMRRRGFTLIELLVSISVLAIVAVLGWRGLDSIVRARVALNSDLEYARGLQLAFAQMQSDCDHIAVTTDIGKRPVLAVQNGRLVLVRTVFAENQPSRVQVVTYRLSDGVLTRRESLATRDLKQLDAAWTAATGETDIIPAVTLHSGVQEMTIETWNKGIGWVAAANGSTLPGSGTSLGSTNPNQASPTGLRVSLQMRDRAGAMVKVFLLGAA